MSREDFLKARQNGIGGSDIGAILGVSKFKTAVDVYLAKTAPNPEEKHSEQFYWGHALEAPIINRFCEETGYTVQARPPLARHPQHEWAIANADALILDSGGKPEGILEIKTSSAYKTKEWGMESGDEIPMEYIAQVQWYMAVFGLSYGYLAVLIGGNQYKHYRLERDEELIELMLDKAASFWVNHVLAKAAPEPANSDDLIRLHPQDDGEAIEADTETLTLYNALAALKEQEKALSEQIKEREYALKAKIGSHAVMQINGNPLFTWKNQTSRRFDRQAFAEAYPDLYREFQKTTESRVFRLK